MARVAQVGETDTQAAYNRTLTRQLMPLKVAVAQNPDNFELGEAPAPEHHTELILKFHPAVSQSAKCLGDECAMWRWQDPTPSCTHGFCGLSGTPAGAA